MNPRAGVPTPVIVATGFTSALLGDERTLREFVMGDLTARAIQREGRNVVLYLINDTFDPLNVRQLRIGVKKDPDLIQLYTGFCGRPIAEIPDPFACHESYAEHFAAALMKRLHGLDIHPVLLDSYRAYAAGDYAPFIAITFERYGEIQAAIRAEFPGYEPHDLFRLQCPSCQSLDATSVVAVHGDEVTFACRRCGGKERHPWREVRGKLTWKLDCAARWNLYGIHVETFAKAHVAPLGTYAIASFVSRRFFGGIVPKAAPYGHVRMSRECAGKLLGMLPPTAFKGLLGENPTRDLEINRDSIEGFCRKVEVRPGVSYVDFVRGDLGRLAIQSSEENGAGQSAVADSAADRLGVDLIRYARRFSEFFYDRSHEVRLPNADLVADVDPRTASLARDAIARALELRRQPGSDPDVRKAEIKHFLATQPRAPRLHTYLRRVLRQEGGPALATVLSLFPSNHLEAIHAMLVFLTTGGYRSKDPARPSSSTEVIS